MDREWCKTRLESPMTNKVPTGSPSRPSLPILMERSSVVLTTLSGKSPAIAEIFAESYMSNPILVSITVIASTPREASI